MSNAETMVLQLMSEGVRKFDNFLDQIPDEFFGVSNSSKEALKKSFKQAWESNPYQTLKQVVDKIVPTIINDFTNNENLALINVLKTGVQTDLSVTDLPNLKSYAKTEQDLENHPSFTQGQIDADELLGINKTFRAKGPTEIN